MRLLLIGDIHRFRLLVPPWRLLGKRLLGQANVWWRRRRQFHALLLDAVLSKAIELDPDVVLLSGDLTSTALDGEFRDAAAALAPLLQGRRTVLVPGNHDRYTPGSHWRRRLEKALPHTVPAMFPHLERLDGCWHLLALDASLPRLWSSRGRLGGRQIQLAAKQLAPLTDRDGLIVLCHYPFIAPPTVSMPWGHQLADAAELRKLLASCPARILYLHGHIHQSWSWQPPAADLRHVLDINAGAPCLATPEHPLGQGFWQIDLPPDPDSNAPPTLRHHVAER